MINQPFSQACENNKQPILARIQPYLVKHQQVLEVGSGTGQHAVFFAQQMPHLQWQTSDLTHNHEGIMTWIASAKLPNVLPPLHIDVTEQPWPVTGVSALYTANTLHIMSWPTVIAFFKGLDSSLSHEATVFIYGPFKINGDFTSASNAAFDQHLRQQQASMGIRDLEQVQAQAAAIGLELRQNFDMPANNQLLVFQRG